MPKDKMYYSVGCNIATYERIKDLTARYGLKKHRIVDMAVSLYADHLDRALALALPKCNKRAESETVTNDGN